MPGMFVTLYSSVNDLQTEKKESYEVRVAIAGKTIWINVISASIQPFTMHFNTLTVGALLLLSPNCT